MIVFERVRDVRKPEQGTRNAAGIDIFVPDDYESITLKPQGFILIKSGLKFLMPPGTFGLMVNRSSISSKNSIIIGACLIDQDYSGEVHINLINVGAKDFSIMPGMKIGQIIFLKNEETFLMEQNIPDSRTGGFGSTDV